MKELTAAKAIAVASINTLIGNIRAEYITVIPGQEMIYGDKEKEAIAFLAEPTIPSDLTPYPFIEGEVGLTAPSAYEVAQVFVNKAAMWRPLGAQLEQLRVGYGNAIYAATTKQEITGLVDTLNEISKVYKNV